MSLDLEPLTCTPGKLRLARDRQRRMLAAIRHRNGPAIDRVLAEGPLLEFELGHLYHMLIMGSAPVPISNETEDPLLSAVAGWDVTATAAKSDPHQVIGVYVGRMGSGARAPHIFKTLEEGAQEHKHMVIADMDVLAQEEVGGRA